ncbi:MAG: hypothetical protein ACPGSM_01705, partial [Thiolinea sp.]
ELKRITSGGHYGDLTLQGTGELETDGVVIDAPGQAVLINRLQVSNVRYPLIVRRVGQFVVNDYVPHTFWGDTLNIRASHVHIGRLAPQNIIQKLPYDTLHQDIIFQAYAVAEDGYTLNPNGVIEDICIRDINVSSPLTPVNGIMLSEVNRYSHFYLGQDRLHVGINAPYWLSGNTLEYAVVGGRDNLIFNPADHGQQPTVRLQNVKHSVFHSHDDNFWDLPGMEQAVLA